MEFKTSIIRSLEKKPDRNGTPINEAEAIMKNV